MAINLNSANLKLPGRLQKATRFYIGLSLLFFLFLCLISLLEISSGAINHHIDTSFWKLTAWSWLDNLKLCLQVLLPLYLIFIPLYLISRKFAKIFFKVLFVLFFVIQLMLLYYFNTTLVMLGSDLFGYSPEEITQTVGASGSLSLIPILIFIVFIAAIVLALKFLLKKIQISPKLGIIFLGISFLFLIFGFSENLEISQLETDFENNLVKNKSAHFYDAAYTHFNPEIYETDIYADSYVEDFFNKYSTAEPLEYVDETNYPFLHKKLKGDVLSPFFRDSLQKKPNIVIILVEGLGRAFTNKGAYLGNFTPFLDSLSTRSLYWSNLLSSGGRTFAVLPSLLGSLPFAETGFMEMNSMPEQMSLINLLGKNEYETSFYYGGNAEFDNMAKYLRKNNIDNIKDESKIPNSYKKIPASNSGFTWGYGDKELFRYYLNTTPDTPGKPKLNVMLTVTTHSPFLIDETEKYTNIFEKRMDDFGFSEDKKDQYRNYTKQYTSILYTDDALKNFFKQYRKRKDFENTIFIITGDHRIPEIPMASTIDRYHVPLIIYSPLLKRTAEIESVSSHFDVAPSLTSFLGNNFDIKLPAENSFIGQGLDTTRNFQNIHQIPLKQTKTDLKDFVLGEYHLSGDEVYELDAEMKEKPLKDPSKKEELLTALNQFKVKNSEIIEGKKILPDSVFKKYLAD